MGETMKPIKITDAVLKNKGRTVTNYIHVFDERLRKYFNAFHFYAEYDRDVSDVPISILNIPALSSVLHFAWAVGVDVEINELDETYFDGMKRVKEIYENHPAYRFLSFDSTLNVSKTRKNKYKRKNRSALLFSGGLDSLSSYISRKPDQLIMIWGLDIPTNWSEFWNQVIEKYEHLPLTTIKTNTLEIYKQNTLNGLGSDCPAGYYAGYSFNLITFGVCPPVAVGNVDKVMMASTYPIRQYGNPTYPFQNYKPHVLVDNNLGWANIETFDVENDFNRPEKIERFVKPYFETHGPSLIRVCGNIKQLQNKANKSKLNCSLCDKCGRAIALLSNYNIDPNDCGFCLNEKTFARIKNNIISGKFTYGREKYYWGEQQKHIKEEISSDFCGSRSFLEWLRGYEL